jgi:thiamine-monophosphate kinase
VASRAGAWPGDGVWLTGALGAAMLGFDAMRSGIDDQPSLRAYARPIPLLAEGKALAPVVGAMMDISDGLLLDATRMALASSASFRLDRDAIPLASGVAAAGRAEDALRWGDDYQLLFTLPQGTVPPVAATRIGEVAPAGQFPLLLDGAPPDLERPLGYLHGSAR